MIDGLVVFVGNKVIDLSDFVVLRGGRFILEGNYFINFVIESYFDFIVK